MYLRQNQKGFSLLEMAMVMGIVAVMAVSAISFFNGASEGRKTMELAKNITKLTSIIRNQYAAEGTYTNIARSTVINASNFPRQLQSTTAANMKHYWDQGTGSSSAIEVASASSGAAFTLTINNLPKGACTDIVSKLWNDYDTVVVNTTTISDTGDVGATAACGGAGPHDVDFTTS